MKKFAIAILTIVSIILTGCGESGPGPGDFNKGLTQLRAGNSSEAYKIFAKLDSLSANSPWGKLGRAIYHECESFEYDALNVYQMIIRDTADFLPALLGFSGMTLADGRPHIALGAARRAAKIEAFNPDVISALAMALIVSGENDEALKELDIGFEKNGDHPKLLIARAEYYLNIGDPDAARLSCQSAIKAAKSDSVLLDVADIYARLGFADSSAYYYKEAAGNIDDNYYLAASAADGLVKLGYFDDARIVVDDLQKSGSDSFRKLQASRLLYEYQEKPFSAYMFFVDAYRLFSKIPSVLLDLAHLRIKMGDSKLSVAHYDQAVVHADQSGYPKNNLIAIDLDRAERYFDIGDGVNASGGIKYLLDDPPEDYRAMRVAALFYGFLGDDKSAQTMLDGFESFTTNNAYLTVDCADVFRRIDSLDRAEGLYKKSLALKKFDYRAIMGMLDIFDRREKPDQALEFLNGLDNHVSLFRPIALKKFDYLMALKRFDEAFSFAKKIIENGPGAVERYGLALNAAKAAGKQDMIPALLDQMIDANPENARAHALLAEQYFEQGKHAEADNASGTALSFDPNNRTSWLIKARLQMHENNVDSAVAIYNSIMKYNEFVPEALYNLALMKLKSGQELQYARNHIYKALEVDPDNSDYYVVLGRIQNALKIFASANQAYQKAVLLDKSNSEAYYYSGMNNIDLNKKSEARKNLNKAISLGLKDEMKAKAEEALKQL